MRERSSMTLNLMLSSIHSTLSNYARTTLTSFALTVTRKRIVLIFVRPNDI